MRCDNSLLEWTESIGKQLIVVLLTLSLGVIGILVAELALQVVNLVEIVGIQLPLVTHVSDRTCEFAEVWHLMNRLFAILGDYRTDHCSTILCQCLLVMT